MPSVFAMAIFAAAHAQTECWTEVHKAAEAGDTAALSKLLAVDRFSADAADLCDTAIRPLLLAANSNSSETVRLLLAAGASTNVAHGGNGATPLHAAAASGNVEIVRLLLEARSRVDTAEERNWTALSFAAQQGHGAIVEELIAHGADIGWATRAGLTSFMLAFSSQRVSGVDTSRVLELLETSGAAGLEESALWLVGQLPLKTLAKLGVTNTAQLERLLGRLDFAQVVAGINPEQLAIHQKLAALQRRSLEGGDEEGGVAPHAVGGGPMPVFSRQLSPLDGAADPSGGGAEVLVLRFDAQPGSMVWQLAILPSSSSASAGARLQLRGQLPPTTDSNYLDPTNVARWEVAVTMAEAAGAGTKWVRASKLRLVRGAQGARLAANDDERRLSQRQQRPPPPPAGHDGNIRTDEKQEL